MTGLAVVTGGSRGVGAASAIALAEDGHDVVLVHRRDRAAAEAVRRRVTEVGRECHVVTASLGTSEGCAHILATVLDLGHIDVLVHAAGVVSSGALVAETTDEELDRLLAVHLHGPFRLTRGLLPSLRTADRSAVVFVSSSVTGHMRAGGGPYNIGKAAMEAFARTLAMEERPHGVRVNIVSPGLVDTELGRRFIRAAHGVEIERLAPLLPYGRVCTPEDVANAVRWLASAGASYLSGENIRVNGGDDTVSSDVESSRVALAARERKVVEQ